MPGEEEELYFNIYFFGPLTDFNETQYTALA
jgi:hypothetical protein